MVVSFRPRNPSSYVQYNMGSSKSFIKELRQEWRTTFRNEKAKTSMENFLNGKTVKSARRLKQAAFLVGVTAFAILTGFDVVEATTSLSQAETDVMNQIDAILLKIQLICGGISVGLAAVMAMIAGIFRIVGLREEAKRRYQDAAAGMTMVLTAPVVLGLLATVVRGLLKMFPQYAV